jgi:hypothetical protein
MRRWKRDVAESLACAGADACADADTNAYADTDANTDANTHTDAERRHDDHDYIIGSFTEDVDGSCRHARDVCQQ